MRYFVLLLHCLGSIRRFAPCEGWCQSLPASAHWVEKCVVMALLPGLVSRLRKVFSMNCWFCLVSFWLCCCFVDWGAAPFGVAFVSLLVGFLLGVFLLVVKFRVLLLSLLVLRRCHGVVLLLLLGCLTWLVVLGCFVVGGLLGRFKRVRLHRNPPAHLAAFGGNGNSDVNGVANSTAKEPPTMCDECANGRLRAPEDPSGRNHEFHPKTKTRTCIRQEQEGTTRPRPWRKKANFPRPLAACSMNRRSTSNRTHSQKEAPPDCTSSFPSHWTLQLGRRQEPDW